MKKSLVALATLAAASGAFAQAQSGVTLYGALDAGYFNVSNINGGTATNPGTKSVTMMSGGALVSPVFGLRGTEDLGGGNSAIFAAEGDIEMTNGTTNSNGLFRRKAYAGVNSSSFGAIKLGVEINPLIDLNGQLMPVAGNAVSTMTSTAFGYADFFTKNGVTWNSPNWNGLEATLQKGLSNTIGESTAGSTTNYGLKYTNGGLKVIAAGQDRKAPLAALQQSAAQTTATSKTASILGASYALGDWTLAVASMRSTIGASGVQGGSCTIGATACSINAGTYRGNQFGVGYQVNAALLVGASRTTASGGGNLTNMQARYSLSKRTTVYGLMATADNSKASTGGIMFMPVGPSTSSTVWSVTSPGTAAAATTAYGATAGTKSSAIGAGVIHTF